MRLSVFGLVLVLGAGCHDKDKARPVGEPGAPALSAPPAASATHAVSVPVDVLSSASPGYADEDAGPATVGGEVVDGAALRAAHRARIKADTSAVTVLEGGTPRELGARICEAVVPKKPKDTPILIKPNFGGFDWF